MQFGYCSLRRRTVPPHPISMSSEWHPKHKTLKAPPGTESRFRWIISSLESAHPTQRFAQTEDAIGHVSLFEGLVIVLSFDFVCVADDPADLLQSFAGVKKQLQPLQESGL